MAMVLPRNQPAFNYRVLGRTLDPRLARAAKLPRISAGDVILRGAGWWCFAPI